MKWISVEDELPDEYDLVIVDGGVAKFIGGVWITETGESFGRVIQWKVTHWMPLPAPPTHQ